MSVGNADGVLTLNHHPTSMYFTRHVENKKASTINKVLRSIMKKQLRNKTISSIISDNGREFFY
ncbi:MAG: hypothetical protein ACRC5R_01380 [Mycoplasmatales bacterium]